MGHTGLYFWPKNKINLKNIYIMNDKLVELINSP